MLKGILLVLMLPLASGGDLPLVRSVVQVVKNWYAYLALVVLPAGQEIRKGGKAGLRPPFERVRSSCSSYVLPAMDSNMNEQPAAAGRNGAPEGSAKKKKGPTPKEKKNAEAAANTKRITTFFTAGPKSKQNSNHSSAGTAEAAAGSTAAAAAAVPARDSAAGHAQQQAKRPRPESRGTTSTATIQPADEDAMVRGDNIGGNDVGYGGGSGTLVGLTIGPGLIEKGVSGQKQVSQHLLDSDSDSEDDAMVRGDNIGGNDVGYGGGSGTLVGLTIGPGLIEKGVSALKQIGQDQQDSDSEGEEDDDMVRGDNVGGDNKWFTSARTKLTKKRPVSVANEMTRLQTTLMAHEENNTMEAFLDACFFNDLLQPTGATASPATESPPFPPPRKKSSSKKSLRNNRRGIGSSVGGNEKRMHSAAKVRS